LGGKLNLAVLPPHKEEWKEFIRYLAQALDRLGVEVRLGSQATAESVIEAGPEALILATGAEPVRPNIPGIEGSNVAMALEVLTGAFETGDRVVIVGGGLIGCETAEFLVERGKKVTIVEMLEEMGPDIDLWNRWVILDRLKAAGARMRPGLKVTAITSNGVRAEGRAGEDFFEAESVVIAVGSRPLNGLAESLQGKIDKVITSGDCVEPRRVKQAVEEGFLAACEI
jgi:2,4-dienoyl-CoA reductase (NADPH2)